MANVLTNLFNVATGSGAHEVAMREYLNPLKGGQTHVVSEGPVADYMSSYLKDYVRPDNPLSQGKWNDGIMSVTGIGDAGDPFTKKGLVMAAKLSSDPSFQAQNLFGQGALKKTDSGYEYTGGKFDFDFQNKGLDWFERNILRPSEYKMYFDKDFRPQKKLIHAKRRKQQLQQAKTAAEAAKKKVITTTPKGPPSITQKKKKYTPLPHQTGGGGGVHSGMKTTKTKAPKKSNVYQTASYARRGKADGGLINFYKYGGYLG
jgi:hypothetical protein